MALVTITKGPGSRKFTRELPKQLRPIGVVQADGREGAPQLQAITGRQILPGVRQLRLVAARQAMRDHAE